MQSRFKALILKPIVNSLIWFLKFQITESFLQSSVLFILMKVWHLIDPFATKRL